jgi:S-methylmethionine-dependent homocysteine/selenocysteine methylase
MSKYRNRLKTLMDRTIVTDAGLETWLIFQQGIELPHFAAFDLLKDEAGIAVLKRWYLRFAAIAAQGGHALLLESPTWRANADWGRRLGYDRETLADANCTAIGLLLEIRNEVERPGLPVIVCGNIGPRGDGYVAGERMSAALAEAYHREQIATFAATDADLVSAFTINYVDEGVHARNRRRAAVGRDAAAGDRAHRRRHAQLPAALHDQLRAPDALRRRAAAWRRLAWPDCRPARERFVQEPRRTRGVHRTGRR